MDERIKKGSDILMNNQLFALLIWNQMKEDTKKTDKKNKDK